VYKDALHHTLSFAVCTRRKLFLPAFFSSEGAGVVLVMKPANHRLRGPEMSVQSLLLLPVHVGVALHPRLLLTSRWPKEVVDNGPWNFRPLENEGPIGLAAGIWDGMVKQVLKYLARGQGTDNRS
jgi:hypothetical protein